MQAGLSLCWSHIPQCWKSHAWLNYGCIYTIAFWSELSSTPLCLRAAKALVRLCNCPGSPEPLMFSNVISANDSFSGKADNSDLGHDTDYSDFGQLGAFNCLWSIRTKISDHSGSFCKKIIGQL